MTASPDLATLRRWQTGDLASAHELSRAAGWPHRLQDWQFAFRLGTGFVAVADERVVGSAACFVHGDTHATIGLIIVAPDSQGQGLGRKLTEAALDAAGHRSVLLNATEAGRPLYERLGFRTCGEIRQHQGVVPVPVARTAALDLVVRIAGDADVPALASLDRAASGMARATLLAALREQGSSVLLERARQPIGYAVVRDFGRGRVIGPVVAPDAIAAKALIDHLLASHVGAFVRLDVPTDSDLPAWLAGRGLADVGPATSMVRGRMPQPAETARLFALVSQAIG